MKLDSSEAFTAHFESDVAGIIPLLKKYDSMEKIERHPEIRKLLEKIDDYCFRTGVEGYHYTRAFPEEIREKGLLLTAGEDRREEFLNRLGHLFTTQQIDKIRRVWSGYFDRYMRSIRDKRIWFNFTPSALFNGGAERLLRYYGGENIYMPLTEDPEIEAIIRTIGHPLIVKCHLDTKSLKNYGELVWGKIWLSTYHCDINKEAYPVDTDAHSKTAILPELILEVKDASTYLDREES